MKFNTFNAAMNGICAEFVTDALYYGENRRKRLLRLPVAALIAVITALILALAAGASVIFGWDGVLKDYLGISGTREDELRNSVMEINQSQTIDGLTVTVRQAFGDAHTVYVLAEVRVPEGLPLDGRLQSIVVNIDTKNSSGSYNFACMNIDEESRIQTYLITFASDKKIIGRHMTITFDAYVSLPYVEKLITGSWNFKYKLNYADASRCFVLNEKCGDLTIKDVIISPASIMISVEGLPDDDLSLDEFSVILNDGSEPEIIRYQYLGNGGGKEKKVISIYGKFRKVIDEKNVYAVSINGQVFVLDSK